MPEILLSGHHANIKKWQRKQALMRTYLRRPEMLEDAPLSAEDANFLTELQLRISRGEEIDF